MRNFNIVTVLAVALSFNLVNAQQTNDVATESLKKTYEVNVNGKTIKNAVSIDTKTVLGTYGNIDENKELHNDSITAPKMIVKTVKIDNDLDDNYDEIITFRYNADEKSDFTLITNEDRLMIGLDTGDNLNILDNVSLRDASNEIVETVVVTDEKGKQIELYVERYETLATSK